MTNSSLNEVRDGVRLETVAADIVADGDAARELLNVNAYEIVALTRKQLAVLEVPVAAEGGVVSAEELSIRAGDETPTR